jgi:hypothetical protein
MRIFATGSGQPKLRAWRAGAADRPGPDAGRPGRNDLGLGRQFFQGSRVVGRVEVGWGRRGWAKAVWGETGGALATRLQH